MKVIVVAFIILATGFILTTRLYLYPRRSLEKYNINSETHLTGRDGKSSPFNQTNNTCPPINDVFKKNANKYIYSPLLNQTSNFNDTTKNITNPNSNIQLETPANYSDLTFNSIKNVTDIPIVSQFKNTTGSNVTNLNITKNITNPNIQSEIQNNIGSVAEKVYVPQINLKNYDIMKDLNQTQGTNFVKLEQPIINSSVLVDKENISINNSFNVNNSIDASMVDSTLKPNSIFEFLSPRSEMSGITKMLCYLIIIAVIGFIVYCLVERYYSNKHLKEYEKHGYVDKKP